MKLVNITFEYDYANHGFVNEVDCNYPEARLTGEILVRNHTVFVTKGKLVIELNGYLSYQGSGNLTVEDAIFRSENPLSTDRSTLRLRGMPSCNPDKSPKQFWTLRRIQMSLYPYK